MKLTSNWWLAFSAAMKSNFTCFAARRTPPLFLRTPAASWSPPALAGVVRFPPASPRASSAAVPQEAQPPAALFCRLSSSSRKGFHTGPPGRELLPQPACPTPRKALRLALRTLSCTAWLSFPWMLLGGVHGIGARPPLLRARGFLL